MIKIGDKLPDFTLTEYLDESRDACVLGPNKFSSATLAKDKKIVVFGVPGAFTPTCSEKHAPGYIEQREALATKGVDEVWCVAVNDAFVMGAWGRSLEANGKVRMMADGSGRFTAAMGLQLDLTEGGLGMRCQRFAMIIDKGVVTHLAVEGPGQFGVSSVEQVLPLL